MNEVLSIAVLLDANSAMHFRRADEIDWLVLTGCQAVTLVASPVFVRELEEQKIHNPSRRLRARAADTIRWLNSLLDGASSISIRSGVSLEFLDADPIIDFAAQRLSERIADDHLIATAIAFRDERGGRVGIATADTGLRMKLRPRGIEAIGLPEDMQLPDDPDPLEQENKRLRAELTRLQHRLPKLEFLFPGGERRFAVERRLFVPPSSDEMLAKVKEERPLLPLPRLETSARASGPFDLAAISKGLQPGAPSRQRVERYNSELEAYYAAYGKYADRLRDLNALVARMFELEFELINGGTAPATDIDVVLVAPEDAVFIVAGDLPDVPKEPKPPVTPEESRARAFDLSSSMTAFRTPDLFPHIRTDFDREADVEDDGNRASYSWRNLKHGFSQTFLPLYLRFDSDQAVRSVGIEAEISAAELPEPIKTTLHLVIGEPNREGM